MLFYAPHVAHCPLQVPKDVYDKFAFMSDDEGQCSAQTVKGVHSIDPHFPDLAYKCRQQCETACRAHTQASSFVAISPVPAATATFIIIIVVTIMDNNTVVMIFCATPATAATSSAAADCCQLYASHS